MFFRNGLGMDGLLLSMLGIVVSGKRVERTHIAPQGFASV